MKELETIRARFLAPDIEEEDREENEKLLREWEEGLIQNRNYLSWQNHDITKEIAQKMKDEYKDFALTLANDRELTEKERESIYARQDACLFILSLTERDAKGAIQSIEKDVRRALSMT
jgi:hypothetical protein